MDALKLGFVGGGNMASAILRSILEHQMLRPEELIVSDPAAERREILSQMGVHVTPSNTEAVKNSALIFLCVKPQVLAQVLSGIHDISGNRFFLSIAAGVSVGYIRSLLPPDAFVMRALPNTPLMVGRGVTIIAKSDPVPHEYFKAVISLFSKMGEVVFLEEDLMDTAVALSGSGPAYFFRMAQVMADFAAQRGIDPGVALRIAAGTMEGAAVMLAQTGLPAQQLIAQVSSPGGTTVAALGALDEMAFDDALNEAMHRCVKRAGEMGISGGVLS